MRVADSVIYLVQPVFGFRSLRGQAVVGPTWVEYTFSNEQLASSGGQPQPDRCDPPLGHQVLIPLTNIAVVAIMDEVEERDMAGTISPQIECASGPNQRESISIPQFHANH